MVVSFLLRISMISVFVLGFVSCGPKTMEMSLNTSTAAYPVVSDSTNYTLDFGNGDEEVLVNSVTNIEMSSLGDDQMESAWLQSLVLKAPEGDLSFIRTVKCYLKSKHNSSMQPKLIAQGSADKLSSDYKSIRLDVFADVDLVSYLKSEFVIAIEIRGSIPNSNTSIMGDLTLKMRLKI